MNHQLCWTGVFLCVTLATMSRWVLCWIYHNVQYVRDVNGMNGLSVFCTNQILLYAYVVVNVQSYSDCVWLHW